MCYHSLQVAIIFKILKNITHFYVLFYLNFIHFFFRDIFLQYKEKIQQNIQQRKIRFNIQLLKNNYFKML